MDMEYLVGCLLCFGLGFLAAETHSRLFLGRRFDSLMKSRISQVTLQKEVLLAISRSENEREARRAARLIRRAKLLKKKRPKKKNDASPASDY
jgi:hypothetical protein